MNQTPDAKKLTHLEEGETHLWRGDLSPIGCAAVVNPADSVYLKDPQRIVLGLLRRPSGMNPLTTRNTSITRNTPITGYARQSLGIWRKLTARRFQLLIVVTAMVRSTSSASLNCALANW